MEAAKANAPRNRRASTVPAPEPLESREPAGTGGAVPDDGVPVTIELILLGARAGALTFRRLTVPLPRGVEPDALARHTLGDRLDRDAVLHSTSWRFENDRIVITYAVAPDPDPRAGDRLVAEAVAQGSDGRHPHAQPDHAQVATHACRHLAFLMATDAAIAKASRRQPVLWRLIARFTPKVAGELPRGIRRSPSAARPRVRHPRRGDTS